MRYPFYPFSKWAQLHMRIRRGRPSHFIFNEPTRENTSNIFNYKIPFWLTRPNIHFSHMNKFLPIIRKFDWKLWAVFDEMRWFVEGFSRFFRRRLNAPLVSVISLFVSHVVRNAIWRLKFRLSILSNKYLFFKPYHIIRWSSRNNKMVLSLQNHHHTTLIHIYSGLFIKFFEKRKSLRKSKLVTTTMFNYFRTLLLLSHLRRFIMIFKGQTPFVYELLSILMRKPKTLLSNPSLNVKELLKKYSITPLSFKYLLFTHSQPYCFQKIRSRGRIKRKVRRRLTRLASTTDL